jgi:tRNA (cmo5U34)-methyltransferase
MTLQDTGYAADRWQFDEEVTRVFDDMLLRSIPDYKTMREMVTELGTQFISDTSTVLDIGTSRGDQIARFIARADADYLGLEISDPMLEAAERRFDGEDSVLILKHDLREGLSLPLTPDLCDDCSRPLHNLTLVTAILTMMFIPIEARYRILADIYDFLELDGALIMVEKVIGEGPAIDKLLVGQYQAFKARQGYSDEDIERKRLSLEGVLVPLQLSSHIANLKAVGFTHVDTFWRCLNFVGIIAIKGEYKEKTTGGPTTTWTKGIDPRSVNFL